MNIIICGAGRVGFTIAKLLSEQNHSITVIDLSSEDIQKINDTQDVKGVVGRATFPREYSSEIKEEHMGRHARGRFAQPFLSVMYGTFTGISNSVGSFGSDPDELPLTSEAFDPWQRIEGFQTRGFLSLVRLTGCSYEFTEDVRGGLYMPNTMLFTDTGENIDEVRSVHDDRDILGRQTAVFMYKPFAEVLGLEVGQPFMQAASRIAEFYGGLSKPGWEVRNSWF